MLSFKMSLVLQNVGLKGEVKAVTCRRIERMVSILGSIRLSLTGPNRTTSERMKQKYTVGESVKFTVCLLN